MTCLPLSSSSHSKGSLTDLFSPESIIDSKRNGYKGIISSAGGYRIEFIFPSLEALFNVTNNLFSSFVSSHVINVSHFIRTSFHQKINDLIFIFIKRFLGIRFQNLIYFRKSEPSILLRSRHKNNVSDYIKGGIQGFGLIVPHISHLKTTG